MATKNRGFFRVLISAGSRTRETLPVSLDSRAIHTEVLPRSATPSGREPPPWPFIGEEFDVVDESEPGLELRAKIRRLHPDDSRLARWADSTQSLSIICQSAIIRAWLL
jgi:hypothetical protein